MKTYPYLVIRGGCWGSYSRSARVAFRYEFTPDYCGDGLGLRLVRSKR